MNSELIIVVLILGCYAAFVGFYYASPFTGHSVDLEVSAPRRLLVKIMNVFLLFLIVWITAAQWGWEYAIPIFIGISTLTGLINVVIAEKFPSVHIISGFMAMAICIPCYLLTL